MKNKIYKELKKLKTSLYHYKASEMTRTHYILMKIAENRLIRQH